MDFRPPACLLYMLALAILGGLLSAGADAQSDLPRFEPVAEEDAFPISVNGDRFQRGYLVVAQDRSEPGGLQLRLPVVRVRAVDPDPSRAPVVFLPGGPGVGSLSAARFPGAYLWTQDRDFIVIGRRGTRFAQPSLQCEAIGPALAATGPSAQVHLLEALDQCKSELTDLGVKLEHFHSAASAQDLEALRIVLDEDKLAFFALSYGTRLALTYARDFPGRVESMVLDSPLPHSARFDDEYAFNLEHVLRRVTQLCADDRACATRFPDLERRFFEAVDAATRACDPAEESAVCGTDLVGRVPVFSLQTLAEAPSLMAQVLNGPSPAVAGGGSSDFDWGVRLSIWCSEALPFSDRSSGRIDESFAGIDSAVFLPETCDRWGVPKRPAAEVEATFSDVPVLILAGELDALTPPRWGLEASQGLEFSRVIIVPAGFHTETTNWGGDGCAMSLAGAFFRNPSELLGSSQTPDCIAARRYPDFALPD